jgi:hypothetical protein
MLHPLDALALASLDEGVLVKKLAALWCQHYGNSAPTSGADILDWVREDYGDILKKGRDRALGLALGAEVKRQLAVRKRRKESQAGQDILELPITDGARQRALLERVLGAPRKWVSKLRTAPGAYSNYCITSGLVAALIPTNFRLRALRAPSLLVYRQPGDRARSYLVPGGLTTLSDVLVWLIPEKLHHAIKLGQVRVEHDGRTKKVRATYADGSVKLFSWRKVRNGNE